MLSGFPSKTKTQNQKEKFILIGRAVFVLRSFVRLLQFFSAFK